MPSNDYRYLSSRGPYGKEDEDDYDPNKDIVTPNQVSNEEEVKRVRDLLGENPYVPVITMTDNAIRGTIAEDFDDNCYRRGSVEGGVSCDNGDGCYGNGFSNASGFSNDYRGNSCSSDNVTAFCNLLSDGTIEGYNCLLESDSLSCANSDLLGYKSRSRLYSMFGNPKYTEERKETRKPKPVTYVQTKRVEVNVTNCNCEAIAKTKPGYESFMAWSINRGKKFCVCSKKNYT